MVGLNCFVFSSCSFCSSNCLEMAKHKDDDDDNDGDNDDDDNDDDVCLCACLFIGLSELN